MREIKFRGLMNNGLDWDCGYYFSDDKGHYIVDFEGIESCIMPETVGQYIGLKDENLVEIYEGDICKVSGDKYTIVFKGMGLWFEDEDGDLYVFTSNQYRIEVIGNIHQNPELL